MYYSFFHNINRQNWGKIPWQVLFPEITGEYFPTELKKENLSTDSRIEFPVPADPFPASKLPFLIN